MVVDSTVGRSAPLGGGLGRGVVLQEEFLIELWEFLLGGAQEEFAGDRHQDAMIAQGMLAERFAQLLGHESGVAGGLHYLRSSLLLFCQVQYLLLLFRTW